jgi:hypothetical protein
MTITNLHKPLSKAGAEWLLAVANPLGGAKPSAAPAPTEVPSLLRAAEVHGVMPAALKALSLAADPNGAAGDTPSIDIRNARQAIADARTRQVPRVGFELLLKHHGEAVLAALRAAGVEAAMLKGPVFARRLYANPAMRSFTDIDIIIPIEARATAGDVLRCAGFELHSREYRAGKDYCEDNWLLIDDPKVGIEIHSDLVHNPKLRRAASVTFADIVRAGNGDAEDATAILFVAAAHGAISHQFDRLQHVVDVALAVTGAAGQVDTERLSRAARASGIMTAVHAALVLAARTFKDARCLEMAEALRPSTLNRLASGLIRPRTVIAARSDSRSDSSWRRKVFRQAIRFGGHRRVSTGK